MRVRTILADDVPELRRLIRHVLEWSDRFEVVGEADDGRAAIELVRKLTPELVLLDISMPVMDGMEALPRIMEASPTTKVIMLSGFEAGRVAQSAVALGAVGYIEKGSPPGELIERIEGYLRHPEVPDGSPVDTSPILSDPPRTDEALEALTDFTSEEMMSLVAHEIRNPLAVIQGFGVELMNRWETMPEHVRRDAVRRMTDRARYLNTVVSNLMYMRRVKSAPEWVESTTEACQPLLERLADELRDLAKDHPVHLQVAKGLPQIDVNVQRLRQVLTNLVVNASKFSPKGTPITVTAAEHPEGVTISVQDEGPGIPEDKREEIFEKFKRLSEGGSGIGLGLYISKALMASMGGGLWADDGPGKGACMVCLLPRSQAQEAPQAT
jgi:signal transduction histidine kinase